jgi:hypothetical protein
MERSGDGEKRRIPRQRVLKGAQIRFHGRSAAIDCVVRDSSKIGARLFVESPFGIPDRFELAQKGAAPRFCRVVWRKANQIGVEFLDP